ncbi:hypothetical protein JCM11641_001828 [Rhodosporidiobolus odoratus]
MSQDSAMLLRLLIELLEQIFNLAYGEGPFGGPVCRALLPYHRKALYSTIVLRRDTLLHRLPGTLEHCSVFSRMVRHLETVDSGTVRSSWEEKRSGEHRQNVLQHLPALQTLSLTSERLFSTANELNSQVAARLKSLTILHLTLVTLPRKCSQLDPAFLQHYACFPSLHTLYFEDDGDLLALPYSDVPPVPLARILLSRLDLMDPSIPSWDQPTFSNFTSFLAAISKRLVWLRLHTQSLPMPGRTATASADYYLPYFAHLEHLELCHSFFPAELPTTIRSHLTLLPSPPVEVPKSPIRS